MQREAFRQKSPNSTPVGKDLFQRSLAWTVLAGMVLAFSGIGCRQIASYDPAPLPSSMCSADVVLYADLAPAPDVQFLYHGLGKASEVPELVRFDNHLQPVPLYRWGRVPEPYAPWVAEGAVPPVLRGAWLVRLDVDDAGESGSLLSLDLRQPLDVETVWVAFDTRGTEPTWLTQSFEPYGSGPDDELATTLRTSTNEAVRFRLWRLRDSVDLGQPLPLGGNDDPSAVWPGPPGAQYLVFVRRRPIPDLSSPPVKVGEHRFENCEGDLVKQEQDFDAAYLASHLGDWLSEHPSWNESYSSGLLQIEFVPGSCEWITITGSNGEEWNKYCFEEFLGEAQFPQYLVNDWPVESRASVDPSGSSGQVSLDGGSPTQTPLRGEVSFRAFDDGSLRLDDLSLFAEPFSSGGLDVAHATFSHEAAIDATCVGQSFPHRLCDGYQVPEGSLRLFAAARVGSQDYSATLENEQPVDVEVDLNQRIFRFEGGPFEGAVTLEDGSEIQVVASFDFLGQFENFAPVALAGEGGDRFPCVDNRQGRVRLDAGASYDAEGGLVAYQWLEDAGTSTQRELGTAAVVEVDLAVGTHDVTLIVEDQEGVRSLDTQSVEVFDDVLETAAFPADVWAPSSGNPQGTVVAVGSASGADGCAGQPLVLGDLPEENLFPDGLRLVEWTVDDGHGNVARDTQKVFVVSAADFPPPVAWVQATPLVGFAGTLYVDFGTSPQGHAVTVDEYLIVTRYDGTRWSIDARGRVGEPDQLAPRRPDLVLGVAATSGQVALSGPGDLFYEEGPYAIEYVLVRPGASPLDSTSVVGWDGAGWQLVP